MQSPLELCVNGLVSGLQATELSVPEDSVKF